MEIKKNLFYFLFVISFLIILILYIDDNTKLKYKEHKIKPIKVSLENHSGAYIIFNQLRIFESKSKHLKHLSGTFYFMPIRSETIYINFDCLNLMDHDDNLGAPTIFHPVASMAINNIEIDQLPVKNLQWKIKHINTEFTLKLKPKCPLFDNKKQKIL